jgi:hypothetical protein
MKKIELDSDSEVSLNRPEPTQKRCYDWPLQNGEKDVRGDHEIILRDLK